MEQILVSNLDKALLKNDSTLVMFAAVECNPCGIVKEALYILKEEQSAFHLPVVIAYLPGEPSQYELAQKKYELPVIPIVRIYSSGSVIAEKKGAFGDSLKANIHTYKRWIQRNCPQ